MVRLCFLFPVLLCVAGVAQAPEAPTQKPSSLLQPAIDSVARAGSHVDLNRWKGSAAVRDEVDGYLASMQKDMMATLPPLIAAADAAPDSAAASLPVLLNLDALYSVLLRVTIAAHSYAPREQSAALDQAATLLDSARRDMGDTLLASARANEKRVTDLQAKVQEQAATLAAAQQTPAPTVTPTKKTKGGKSRSSSASSQ